MKIDIPDKFFINVSDDNCIKVWPFDLAPKALQDLSRHGGDEDWVAFIPSGMFDKDAYIGWMEESTPFGCFSVSKHEVLNGEVRIGAHS